MGSRPCFSSRSWPNSSNLRSAVQRRACSSKSFFGRLTSTLSLSLLLRLLGRRLGSRLRSLGEKLYDGGHGLSVANLTRGGRHRLTSPPAHLVGEVSLPMLINEVRDVFVSFSHSGCCHAWIHTTPPSRISVVLSVTRRPC